MDQLPNIPGIRRDLAAQYPVLYKQYRASMSDSDSISSTGSLSVSASPMQRNKSSPAIAKFGNFAPIDEQSVVENSDNYTLQSYFEDPETFEAIKSYNRSMQSFPNEGESFSDLRGRYSLRSQLRDRTEGTKAPPFSSLDVTPDFVINSKEPVARALAYFYESTPMNLTEPERARKVEIIFHLEDESLEILEPYIPNCGIIQGKMLKRHRVAKPNAYRRRNETEGDWTGVIPAMRPQPEYYTVRDIKAGARLLIYQREFIVIDCDDTTKQMLFEFGTPFGETIPLPEAVYDPRITQTAAREARLKQKRHTNTAAKKTTGFFAFDRKVLRFFGVWDNRARLFGDQLYVRLHYYLSDNTMEVLPAAGSMDGRDRIPKFLKKNTVMMNPDLASVSGVYDVVL